MFSRTVIAHFNLFTVTQTSKNNASIGFSKRIPQKDQSNLMSVFLLSGGVISVVIRLTFSKNDMKSGCVYLPSY